MKMKISEEEAEAVRFLVGAYQDGKVVFERRKGSAQSEELLVERLNGFMEGWPADSWMIRLAISVRKWLTNPKRNRQFYTVRRRLPREIYKRRGKAAPKGKGWTKKEKENGRQKGGLKLKR